MLKYTLVLATASVTIAYGEKLTVADVKEVTDTCKGAFDDLKTAVDSIKALQGNKNCKDYYNTCPSYAQNCSWDATTRHNCPLTCGVCKRGPDANDFYNALSDAGEVEKSAKECIDVLKEKCGSLSDYESILGVDVAYLAESFQQIGATFGLDVSASVDLGDLQTRAGCGVEGATGTGSTGTGSTGTGSVGRGTGSGEEEEEEKADLPIPVLAGVAGGVLVLGAVAGGVYKYLSKNDDAKNTAAAIAEDRV